MGIDWVDVLKTLGSTAIITAILGFLAQTTIKHFLRRDIERHKADLKREADLELARARAGVEEELAAARARTEGALAAQKADFERQMETFKTELATSAARSERVRQEVVRWANPILGSVVALERRLDNILKDEGYLALSPTTKSSISTEWSVTYEYFLPSTIYLFGRYFCWVRLLEEKLSFELFEKHDEKDRFFDKVRAVGQKLSSYPLAELKGVVGVGDCQVFNLQQQALGETLAVVEAGELRCMRYSEFLEKWPDSVFARRFDPLTRFVDGLTRENVFRWRRLELMLGALEQLRRECERLLTPQAV